MVSQSSQRTLAQPTQPADPARSFNERSHGLMRKIHTLTTALSDFGVEIALLINTPYVEYTYESTDGMLRDFNTELPEENRFRPEDVKNLFRGRVLACPSIKSMSPLRGYSGRSSPTPSTSSTASASSISLPAATGLTFPIPLPTRPVGPATTLPSTSPISDSAAATGDTSTEMTLPPLSIPQGSLLQLLRAENSETRPERLLIVQDAIKGVIENQDRLLDKMERLMSNQLKMEERLEAFRMSVLQLSEAFDDWKRKTEREESTKACNE
ncbi:hypothetical protein N0V88_007357 [Collariella sp. IMI 366227]|nr:hypothetical protein N0V88_007357 [Collariella sp. IMI 366227]